MLLSALSSPLRQAASRSVIGAEVFTLRNPARLYAVLPPSVKYPVSRISRVLRFLGQTTFQERTHVTER